MFYPKRKAFQQGDKIYIDFENGIIGANRKLPLQRLPDKLMKIFRSKGLAHNLKLKLIFSFYSPDTKMIVLHNLFLLIYV
jgi:hypothetical protein